ncbi:hypothetical protein GPALN_010331 [Globodera pallida]|nr:hypothetical protein GPALN_010331 [Globodera pallida]
MSITKSTGRTPKLDKLNQIQLIRILLSQSLITLENPIQLIRILLLSQSLITLDKLNPIQLIRILRSQSLITLRTKGNDDEMSSYDLLFASPTPVRPGHAPKLMFCRIDDELGWAQLPQPLYSPALKPFDYHVLKNFPRGKQFTNDEQLENAGGCEMAIS